MAKELAHFKNFAKLKDTKVAFNDITVIAGKPGTGKSYVMKFMYAIDEIFSKKNTGSLLPYVARSDLKFLRMAINILVKNKDDETSLINYLNNNNFTEFHQLIKSKLTEENMNLLKDSILRLEDYHRMDDNTKMSSGLINLLNSIFSNTNQIAKEFVVKNNFFETSIDGNEIYWKDKAVLNSQEPIFVETPLILEFKKFMKREEGKTPYHIESLLNILDTDYSFTDEKQKDFIVSFVERSKEIIQGDIHSDGDSFSFEKNGKTYDIINASSGTKSIGLLQYLVTNKALKKGSVLYWEEPEVHLHPEWQLRMIELFIELMNAGVKIVFSTHSPYMCDYLNAMSQKKGNDFSDRVSFNLFEEKDGIVENHILESQEDWNKIQAELLDPLEEIMWEYI